MVFVVLFHLTLLREDDETAFLTAFRRLSESVRLREPGALTYELHHVVEDGAIQPRRFLVVERYADLASLDEVHNRNPFLGELVQVLEAMNRDVVNGEPMRAQFRVERYENSAAEAALRQLPSLTPADLPPLENPLLQKGILVFGGSRAGTHPSYVEESKKLGTLIATQEKRPLVYGGGTVGVMGAVAQSCLAADIENTHNVHNTGNEKKGGTVISIIPSSLQPREVAGEMIGTVVYYTNTMSERKSIMFAHADTVIALPGGVGTLDELLEVITLFQLNAYRPKIGLLNANGFYDPFLDLLRHTVKEGFVGENVLDFMVVRPTAEELMEALSRMEPPVASKELLWEHRP